MIPHNRPDIGEDERLMVQQVMNGEWWTEGRITELFEKALEEYLGAPTCVVNSGSSALMCALLASGFKPNDLVVVPAITYVATAMIPLMLGARVRLVDVDPATFNMDHHKLRFCLAQHDVSFIIPVHIGGRICEPFEHIEPRYTQWKIIQDSAQAMGAAREGCFSFQMTKQLTTVEGGCITSIDREFIDRCRRIKNYGRTGQVYIHDLVGSNFRTTDINSAIGLEQLRKIDGFIKRRRDVLHRYYTELRGAPDRVGFQAEPESPMFCFVMVDNKSAVLDQLQQAGIDARTIWPPLDVQPCLTSRLENGGGPNADYIYQHTISLPLSNGITDEEVDTVIKEYNRIISA